MPDADDRPSLPFPGLTPAQVEESRAKHGENVLTPPARDPWWKLYLEKFEDPIVRILLIAAGVALAVGAVDGHFMEGLGILAAVLLSTSIAFVNEYRAGKEFDLLNRVSDEDEVAVIRDGRHGTVKKRELVVGDVVELEQGGEIPADAEVLQATSFRVNESSLTGESVPVAKIPAGGGVAFPPGTAYPPHLVYRGCTVSDGHGLARITAVGDASEIGKTARAAAEETQIQTPLNKQLEKLARLIGVCGFLAAGFVFVAMVVIGGGSGEMHDLVGDGDGAIKVPLVFGQWYCFALLSLVMMILTAQVWLPYVYHGLGFLGRKTAFPAWLEKGGARTLLRLAVAAVAVAAAGIAAGYLFKWLPASPEDWLPLPALAAFLRYFMVAVTVIVVAVPEGLPMSVTLSLAYSMRKMTASNNLVRKIHACETIGAATVICTDKTGTLTRNEMRVHAPVFPALGREELGSDAEAKRLVTAVAANSTANLERTPDGARGIGNPTECALLLWLEHNGVDYEPARAAFAVRQQLTFTTERKFMATAGVGEGGERLLLVKGAPEIVLARCLAARGEKGRESPLDEAAREAILGRVASYQARGMRIIGVAHKAMDEAGLSRELDEQIEKLIWDGFFAIADPVRDEVPGAVEAALAAGIEVKIVTGDNQNTAKEIARRIGLWDDNDGEEVGIVGDAFASLDDKDASAVAGRLKLMSRARPMHKLRLVNLLQKRGEVVAVTGDGTNDAPALNHADVGLAMGRSGTSVAKEAADIILLDDSFKSIVNAVAWGRSLYLNIQKFIVFQLTINVAAVGIALLGPFLGISLPLTVAQMLWVNLIMDTFAALALASEPPDWALMKNPPRRPDAFIITPGMRRRILGVGLFFLALFAVLAVGFDKAFPLDDNLPGSRENLTIFFTAFVGLQFWNLFNARAYGSTRSALAGLGKSRGFLLMVAVIAIGQVLLVQFGGAAFRVTPLPLWEWLAIAVATSPVLWLGELNRWRKRRAE